MRRRGELSNNRRQEWKPLCYLEFGILSGLALIGKMRQGGLSNNGKKKRKPLSFYCWGFRVSGSRPWGLGLRV